MTAAFPRVLHRIWLGGPEPAAFRAYRQTFVDRCPGWEIRDWTEANLPAPLANQACFDAAPALCQKADIARYELLVQYGGVYVDTDVECLRPLDELFGGIDHMAAFAGWESRTHLCNAVLGARPGSPFFRRLVELLPQSFVAHQPLPRGAYVGEATGPGFLTRCYQYLREGAELTQFAPQVFYPYRWDEPKPAAYGPATFLVHHWAQGGR